MPASRNIAGVFHSMIAVDQKLYVVETNRGFLLRVDPANGRIEKLYDMSIDNAEHNPIVMTRLGNKFYVGTFGEDGGPAELAVFDKNFTSYSLPFQSLHPLVGLAWHGRRLIASRSFRTTIRGPRRTRTSSASIRRRASGSSSRRISRACRMDSLLGRTARCTRRTGE